MGEWSYKRVHNIFLKLLIYIVLEGLAIGIFFVLIPHFIDDFYAKYTIQSIGLIIGGMIVSFLAPYLALRWKVIFTGEEEFVESPKRDHISGEEIE